MVLKSYFRCPLTLASGFRLIPFCFKGKYDYHPTLQKKGWETDAIWIGPVQPLSWLLWVSKELRSISGNDAAKHYWQPETWEAWNASESDYTEDKGLLASSVPWTSSKWAFHCRVDLPTYEPSSTVRKLLLAQSLGNKERFIFCENCRLRVFCFLFFGFFFWQDFWEN